MATIRMTATVESILTQPTEIERALAHLCVRQDLLSADTAVNIMIKAREGHREATREAREAIGETVLVEAITKELGFTFVDLDRNVSVVTDTAMVAKLGLADLVRFTLVPVLDAAGNAFLAASNPGNAAIMDFLRSRPGSPTRLLIATAGHIRARLAIAGAAEATNSMSDGLLISNPKKALRELPPAQVGRSPVVEWTDGTLIQAVTEGASDIHFEFNAKGTLYVRFRIDGVLDMREVSLRGHDREVIGALLSRCSSMDPSNLWEPQDGTFSFKALGRNFDVRVAMLPMEYGPGVVLRLLDSGKIRTKLEDMGFSGPSLHTAREAVASSQGLVLLSGPTGSGKTTTLYSLLREVDAVSRRIVTVEDPIEYRLDFIGQVQIRSDRGDKSLTFARALRSILRMDPDVILVGEVRDHETARTAADAAITGHLVLSTIHASNALATYTRLIEMGVPAFVVAEAISLTVAQRLLRKLHDCAKWGPVDEIDAAVLASHGLDVPTRIRQAVGCPACQGRGYRGRVAVVEMLVPSWELRGLIASRAPLEEVKRAAEATGFAPMIQDAYRHLVEGSTTVSEMFRVLSQGDD